jgi:ABC-type Fe3+ transport system permease subunit
MLLIHLYIWSNLLSFDFCLNSYTLYFGMEEVWFRWYTVVLAVMDLQLTQLHKDQNEAAATIPIGRWDTIGYIKKAVNPE